MHRTRFLFSFFWDHPSEYPPNNPPLLDSGVFIVRLGTLYITEGVSGGAEERDLIKRGRQEALIKQRKDT